ncbi:hypothetical protein BDR04DRAFT_1164137 [Suillus decipiens]|nr:hypothetical protein BDR04DRAFT_1164137 [Suillus decipiens]
MSETQRFEKENGQTACNMDLFDEDDDMEDTESQTQSGKRGTSQMDLDQPPTRTAPLDKREKRGTDPVLPDKRRIKEVDYSETLRSTVYRQEELISNMKIEVEKQREEHVYNMNEMKKQWETTLREKLAQREEELKRKTNEEFQERNNAILAEMEQRFQQEAEKESELAMMERRFSRRHRFQDKDVEMDNNSTMPGDAGKPSSPSAKPQSDTSRLEAIKRIKRTRGISHRVRLVSVAADTKRKYLKDTRLNKTHNTTTRLLLPQWKMRLREA